MADLLAYSGPRLFLFYFFFFVCLLYKRSVDFKKEKQGFLLWAKGARREEPSVSYFPHLLFFVF